LENYLEIKWHGHAGQGVATAATLVAEILAIEGKHVQAFPQFDVEKRSPSANAFNRLSNSPIKTHSSIKECDIVMLMDPALVLDPKIGINTKQDATYIINTSYDADYIKEKLAVASDSIYTIDADSIAREVTGLGIPNIPMISVLFKIIDWLPLDNIKQHLQQLLTIRFSDNLELVAANLKTIDRALKEVKKAESVNLL
jgi:pyruvate ferredoxin oxidoreductase gamma subunit